MPLPRRTILYCGSADRPVPELIRRWVETTGFEVEESDSPTEIEARILRGRGALLVIDDDPAFPEREKMVRRLKGDPFTAIVPVTILSGNHDAERVAHWFLAGADEILTPLFAPGEQRARLGALMVRTERNVGVHPSTRLPGTIEIEREFRRRLDAASGFAVCYADLDHFKEFNDRYSYYDGDRVIFVLSRILHDVVRGMVGADGFVGHIGGDDFIFVVPLAAHAEICAEILAVFDALVPLQYSEQDRRAGYFFGKDRRGQLHRVPLMTLSIGVVTNAHRTFTHPAQISELATEMKSYAKTLPGSVYVVDRRHSDYDIRSGPGGRDARGS